MSQDADRPDADSPATPPAEGAKQPDVKPALRLRRDGALPVAKPAPPADDAAPARAAASPPAAVPAESGAEATQAAVGASTVVEGEAAVGEGGETAPPPKKRGPVRLAIEILVVLLVLFFGFKFGFGPIISSMRGQKSTVVVKNTSDTPYQARLGWRMLQQELYPQSAVQFELFVGMPEHQKLLVVPTGEGGGEPHKVSVPMAPGSVTLVNLKKIDTYWTMDPDKIKGETIAKVDELFAAVAAHEEPAVASEMVRRGQKLGKDAITGSIQEEIVNLLEYTPRIAGAFYSQDKPNPDLPILTNEKIDMALANGRVTFSPASQEEVALVVSAAEERQVQFGEGGPVAVLRKGQQVSITRDPKGNLTVRADLGSQKLKVQEGEFAGNWVYTATKPTGTPDWKWGWAFAGFAQDANQHRLRLNQTFDAAGLAEPKITDETAIQEKQMEEFKKREEAERAAQKNK